MTIVVPHFSINMGFSEREAESATQSILDAFFYVSNLQDVALCGSSGKPTKVPAFDNYSADITYFTFCSTVSTADVDSRAPAKILSLEFSIRLSQSLRNSAHPSTPVITTNVDPLLDTTSSRPVAGLGFALGNFSDDTYWSNTRIR